MIRRAAAEDCRVLAQMAVQMWDSHSVEELEAEFAETVTCENSAFFIRYEQNDPVGFAQCSLRSDYVEGTESTPVGYLEGIFVIPDHRGKGHARELLFACQRWAKDRGCTEFASDCELSNQESLRFHLAMGFTEANRIICFHKTI